MKTMDFNALVEDLKKKEVLEKHGPEIALIKPGKWDYFINWATSKGYQFDIHHVRSYFENRGEVMRQLARHAVMGVWGATLFEK